MNFIKKLSAFLLLCLSTQNILQAGILNNVQQIIPTSSTLSDLLQSMPDNNKIMAYAGAAAIATGAGIGFNFYTDPYRHPRKKRINFIPWIPGIVRTAKKHPYATAGIAATLGASYGLHQHPEVLERLQSQPIAQKALIGSKFAAVALAGIIFNLYTEINPANVLILCCLYNWRWIKLCNVEESCT
jgi:hypothetical protein